MWGNVSTGHQAPCADWSQGRCRSMFEPTLGCLKSTVTCYTGLSLALISVTTALNALHVLEEHAHPCELKPLIPKGIMCIGLSIPLWLLKAGFLCCSVEESLIISWILCKMFTLNLFELLQCQMCFLECSHYFPLKFWTLDNSLLYFWRDYYHT